MSTRTFEICGAKESGESSADCPIIRQQAESREIIRKRRRESASIAGFLSVWEGRKRGDQEIEDSCVNLELPVSREHLLLRSVSRSRALEVSHHTGSRPYLPSAQTLVDPVGPGP